MSPSSFGDSVHMAFLFRIAHCHQAFDKRLVCPLDFDPRVWLPFPEDVLELIQFTKAIRMLNECISPLELAFAFNVRCQVMGSHSKLEVGEEPEL